MWCNFICNCYVGFFVLALSFSPLCIMGHTAGVRCTIVSPIFRSPNACVAVVVFPFRFPFLLQFFPSAFSIVHPQFLTHQVVRHFTLTMPYASCSASCSRQAACFSGVRLLRVLQVLKWWNIFRKWLRKNASEGVTTCQGFHTAVGCWGMTVLRTDLGFVYSPSWG